MFRKFKPVPSDLPRIEAPFSRRAQPQPQPQPFFGGRVKQPGLENRNSQALLEKFTGTSSFSPRKETEAVINGKTEKTTLLDHTNPSGLGNLRFLPQSIDETRTANNRKEQQGVLGVKAGLAPNLAQKNVSNLTTVDALDGNLVGLSRQGPLAQEVFLGPRTEIETSRTGQAVKRTALDKSLDLANQYITNIYAESQPKKRVQFAFPVDIGKSVSRARTSVTPTFLMTDPGKEQEATWSAPTQQNLGGALRNVTAPDPTTKEAVSEALPVSNKSSVQVVGGYQTSTMEAKQTFKEINSVHTHAPAPSFGMNTAYTLSQPVAKPTVNEALITAARPIGGSHVPANMKFPDVVTSKRDDVLVQDYQGAPTGFPVIADGSDAVDRSKFSVRPDFGDRAHVGAYNTGSRLDASFKTVHKVAAGRVQHGTGTTSSRPGIGGVAMKAYAPSESYNIPRVLNGGNEQFPEYTLKQERPPLQQHSPTTPRPLDRILPKLE
ncbi:hypothetical protein HK102_008466 [Quaeritorhiza haematococci]|nr:hypothetical protein HK102_008466 [Quaeritorhiza haematococci]